MYTLISCMIEMEIKILIKDVIENKNKQLNIFEKLKHLKFVKSSMWWMIINLPFASSHRRMLKHYQFN
jgi:hypothetical protein